MHSVLSDVTNTCNPLIRKFEYNSITENLVHPPKLPFVERRKILIDEKNEEIGKLKQHISILEAEIIQLKQLVWEGIHKAEYFKNLHENRHDTELKRTAEIKLIAAKENL